MPIIGILTLIGSLFFAAFNKHNVIIDDNLPSPTAERLHSAYLDNSSTSRTKKIALQAMQGNFNQADQISEFSHDEVLGLVTEFEQSLQGSKEECAELLIELCSKVAETNPKNALLLIGAFHYLPGVADFERETFTSWMENDVSEIFSYLEKESTTAKSHHISVAASVFQNEHQEHFSKYLEWASGFKYDPDSDQIDLDDRTIFADVVTKATTFANENTIEEVVTFLEQHADIPIVTANLANLLESSLMKYPEDADDWFDWLAGLPVKTNEMRTMLVSSAIGGLTEHDPEKVVSLLSSQEFLDQQYLPDSETETPAQRKANQERFFDDILAGYLEKNIQFNPEAALVGAEAFHDQERRKDIEGWARSIISNDPIQDTP